MVYVDGPEDSGNGALDSSGEAVITGGTVVAAGSSGMAETFGASSTQGSILLNTAERHAAGTKIELLDASGSVLLEYTPSKSFNSVVISCAGIQKGETYSVRIDSETAEITMGNGAPPPKPPKPLPPPKPPSAALPVPELPPVTAIP